MRLLLLPLALLATAAAPPPARAPDWTVVPSASSIRFTGAMAGQAFTGAFARWTARIRFDPRLAAPSSIVAVIDLASARSGDASRDEALPTADWFAVARFPRASFVARRFAGLGGGRFRAFGMLRIRDVERPVELPFTLAVAGRRAVAIGTLDLDRTLFGVGQGQFADGATVAKTVRVTLRIAADRAD